MSLRALDPTDRAVCWEADSFPTDPSQQQLLWSVLEFPHAVEMHWDHFGRQQQGSGYWGSCPGLFYQGPFITIFKNIVFVNLLLNVKMFP